MYRLTTDEQSQPQIDALPSAAREPFAEACRVVRLVPWNGDPANNENPDGEVRMLAFGPVRQGLLVYLIVEDDRRVDLLDVFWLGTSE